MTSLVLNNWALIVIIPISPWTQMLLDLIWGNSKEKTAYVFKKKQREIIWVSREGLHSSR